MDEMERRERLHTWANGYKECTAPLGHYLGIVRTRRPNEGYEERLYRCSRCSWECWQLVLGEAPLVGVK